MRNFVLFFLSIRHRTDPVFFGIVYCLLSTDSSAQQWHSLPNPHGWQFPVGVNGTSVEVFKVIKNELYVGGGLQYDSSGASKCIVKFNAKTLYWDSLACGVYGLVHAIEEYKGEIYAGGNFQYAKSCLPWPNDKVPNTQAFVKWNGSQWMSADGYLSSNASSIYTIKYKNDLYIGGNFVGFPVSNGNVSCIARYNGSVTDNMQGGVNGFPVDVRCMAGFKNDLYVGGIFRTAGGITCNNIARWDGSNWHPVGKEPGIMGGINAMAVDTVKNLLYVGGGVTHADTISTGIFAAWDGSKWHAASYPSFDYSVAINAMTFFNGKIYAGAYSNFGNPMDTTLIYWDGSKWTWIPGPNNGVLALEPYNGNLYVGGLFQKIDTTTVNCIACYGDSCPGNPINLTLPYGIKELQVSGLKFKVFPNPAKKEVTVSVSDNEAQDFILKVIGSLGQVAIQQKFSKELKINTSGFSKGMYFIEVCLPAGQAGDEQGKRCHTEKLLIE